ncbi:MAG: XdhC family protein [Marinoscillum sp.]|uniref:XdhC family protein n=1 Tax=Marinoscillum sp. TaxID=2024838 RepID=UPI0032F0DD04
MKEVKNIIESYDKIDFSARKVVLATVVRVSGSSYRNPGARMLILDNGQWVGSISGGCLEGDAMRKARQVMRSQQPMLVTYDTMDDDHNELRIGLGCNGVVDVLLEPVAGTGELDALDHLRGLLTLSKIGVAALVYHSDDPKIIAGERLLLLNDEGLNADYCSDALTAKIGADLAAILTSRKSETRTYPVAGGTLEVLFEVVEPSIEVLIFGAGADAQPVVNLAKGLGWRVTISDECIAHLAPVHFPMADQLVSCQRGFVTREIRVTPYTAIVLMSHNYDYDLEVLKQVVKSEAPYIGILGPKKRADKLFAALAEAKINLTEQDHQRIHSPIGLDIGAETADEIALSILSEVLAKFAGRSGGFLKYHKGPIHKRQGIDDQVFKQVYLHSEDDQQQIG